MHKPIFVLSDGGEVKVTRLQSGEYAADVIAHATVDGHEGVARGCATIYHNEAGFYGRDWEMRSAAIGGTTVAIGDDQFATLREAAKALGDKTASFARTRALAKSLGIAKVL